MTFENNEVQIENKVCTQ